MGKRKRRPLSKNEILQTVKYAEESRRAVWAIPFTVISILCNYTLWKTEGWGRDRLVRYHELVNKYNQMLYDGDVTVDELRQRVEEKGGFPVKAEHIDTKNIRMGNRFLREMTRSVINSENAIYEQAAQHLLEHYAALIDLGFGRKRLARIKEALNGLLEKAGSGELKVTDLQQEMLDKLQMEFESPIM